MALYTISDLHLPLGVDKPMDIFGSAWENYVERLRDNWQSVVGAEDTVIMGGDFSWATYLEQTKADFEFLQELNGRKILLKGNHDYWWTTLNKMRNFLDENGFSDIEFLHNNYFMYDGIAVCGTRGWNVPVTPHKGDDKKIYDRELCRLELSINAAKKENPKELFVFLHYPPLLKDYRENPMTQFLKDAGVSRCYYGHIHQRGSHNAFSGEWDGILYTLCSCDYRGFMPVKVSE